MNDLKSNEITACKILTWMHPISVQRLAAEFSVLEHLLEWLPDGLSSPH